MRSKTTIKVVLAVNVDVEVEFDNLTGQAAIVSSAVSDKNIVTPRTLYAAMKSGDYSNLDALAKEKISQQFIERCTPYSGKHYSEFPDEAIRSVPVPAPTWERVMRSIMGTYCTIPISMITKQLGGMKLYFEPVMSKVPTVYVWNADINVNEFEKAVAQKAAINNPEMYVNSDEGSLCLRWKAFG